MTLFYLVYISQSQIEARAATAELLSIVSVSTAYNLANGLTGALVFTGKHFAQLLEGTEASVREIMDHIRRDPRHARLKVITESAVDRRRFTGWSLAYSGQSTYAERFVVQALAGKDQNAVKLIRLMLELAHAQVPPSAG